MEKLVEERHAFLRKLNAQELGFRNSRAGKAGRYFLISKKCLWYFPHLSSTITNDHLFISLILNDSMKEVLCRLVYHNDKITENKPGGRDEVRLYLNNEIDLNSNFFHPEDIVVLYRISDNDNVAYKIYRFSGKEQSSEYDFLKKILSNGEVKGSHALIPIRKIPFIKFDSLPLIREKIVPEEVREQSLKDPIKAKVEEEDRETVARLIRSTSFRDVVLFFYNYKCAVTGDAIKYKNLVNLEAAHIIPRYAGGGNNPANGLALNRDLHWAFDKGFYTVDLSLSVEVHPDARHLPALQAIHGRPVYLPEDSRARPNNESLKWHNEKVYGIFKQFKSDS